MKSLIALAFLAAATPGLAQPPGLAARTAAPTYASMAASADNYEVKSSQMIRGIAANPDVRAFAEMMIADHGRTSADLMAAAKAATISPTNLLPPEADMLKGLRTIGKRKAERLYVDQQVMAHEKALMLHQGYATQGDNEGLRIVAASALPIVQHHLDEIRRIQAAMGGPLR